MVVVIILLLWMDLFGWIIVVVLVLVVDNKLFVKGKNVLDVIMEFIVSGLVKFVVLVVFWDFWVVICEEFIWFICLVLILIVVLFLM